MSAVSTDALNRWIAEGRALSDQLLRLAVQTDARSFELADLLGAVAGIINQAEHLRRDLLPRLEKANPEAYRQFLGILNGEKAREKAETQTRAHAAE